MKKLKKQFKALFLFAGLSVLLLFSLKTQVNAQEIECTLPPGYVCGATEGTVYDLLWVHMPGYVVPVITSKKCCVSSVQMNACNAQALGCTTVEITNPDNNLN